MKTRRGTVYVDDLVAGLIQETDAGYLFCYDNAYLERPDAQAVSLNLPLRPRPYVSTTLFPFFNGLLAEGSLAEMQCRTLKIDEQDTFGRLLETCHETIGAVTVRTTSPTSEAS